MKKLEADVLVVGGGTGGTGAAIQAARRGAKTILVSEFPWLGGMLTSAGVSAPDGNELVAFQTGLWGAFLRELQQRQAGGLDHAWVSFFTFDPRLGAQIFAEWVKQLPNLYWMAGQTPQEVLKAGDRITGVRFNQVTVQAQITLDATELGDLLAMADIPYRWGWEFQDEWGEPSAPLTPNALTARYPVQAPTWVVILQDFGGDAVAPEIPGPPTDHPEQFTGAWDAWGPEAFLNYGRLPGRRFMINWPHRGNDYGEGVERLILTEATRQEFLQEARWHTQSFARFIQTQLGRRYGLANIFPISATDDPMAPAFGLHPYFRESRHLQGLRVVREQDILPVSGGQVAPLPLNEQGICEAVAIGNYANDHHYPSGDIPLKPKSLRWGGRWTGTPFTIPYRCLIPAQINGLLACEKNISVSHIANGATRLQPLVMNIGQAAGMAAALCVEKGCQPRDLSVRLLQEALLEEPMAPAAIIPFFNLTSEHPDWRNLQRYYLERPEAYPADGNGDFLEQSQRLNPMTSSPLASEFLGIFQRQDFQDYSLEILQPKALAGEVWKLVTLHPEINRCLEGYANQKPLTVWGRLNWAGAWLLVESIDLTQKLFKNPFI